MPATTLLPSRPSRRASPTRPRGASRREFVAALQTRRAVIGVVGLGYVGLPLALAYAQAGFRVLGVDVDAGKVEGLAAGTLRLGDVEPEAVGAEVEARRLDLTTAYERLREADVIFICVPTPYTRNKEPDTSRIAAAAQGVAAHLREGQLVVLRSTSYPGTTEELVRPILEGTGRRVGQDVFLAFAPERVDPGRRDFTVRNTPVVVGGCDPESTARAREALAQVAEQVIPLSSPAAAEMTKLLENVFRNVNIALVNQLAMLCDRMGLNIWEIVEAAATKPYGFLSFRPGPGVGGHCIPVDPYYLAWKAREYDFHMDFIELAARVNEEMPYFVATKIFLKLNGNGRRHPRILVLGVTFKRDIDDHRDSPSVKILELLRRGGAVVAYHDPYVPELRVDGHLLRHQPLSAATLRTSDCVVIATDHSCFDYDWIVRHARRVFDTRNATARVRHHRHKIITL
jgi:UDP-N-acetyl-D-glucosamine dehydrogenase